MDDDCNRNTTCLCCCRVLSREQNTGKETIARLACNAVQDAAGAVSAAAPLRLLALFADLPEALPARQEAKQEICTLTPLPAAFFAVSVILARGVRSA